RTKIDPWFLAQIKDVVDMEERLRVEGLALWREARDLFPAAATGLSVSAPALSPREPRAERFTALMLEAKQFGFADRQLSYLWNTSEAEVRRVRKEVGVVPVYKCVDTCAAEFEAYTPYYYSAYECPIERVDDGSSPSGLPAALEDESRSTGGKERIMILGGGPNRIGQGIEFDYCCCQASFALRKEGYETIMVNSNPETVSTDYDTSDHLFFEPLTVEDVLNVVEMMRPKGLIVQFGGQTPLNLARALESA